MYVFGELLRAFRSREEFTQEAVAELLGVHRHTIRNWEEGNSRPRKEEYIEKLVEILALHPSDEDKLRQAAGYPPRYVLNEEDLFGVISNSNRASVEHDILGLEKLIKLIHDKFLVVPALQRLDIEQVVNFVGREEEINQIIRELRPGKTITIFGVGGVGKSILAYEVVQRIAPGHEPPPMFPDGIICYSFYNQTSAVDALKHIAKSLGEDPLLTSPRDAVVRGLGKRKVLLVLDGTEEADDLQIVLRVCNRCGILITTRSPHDCQGTVIELSSLPLEDSISLVQSVGGVWAENEQVVEELCQMFDGLPLALYIAGKAMAAGEDAEDFLSGLNQAILDSLAQGKHKRDNFALLLERSFAKLSSSTVGLVKLMTCMAYGPIHRDALAVTMASSGAQLAKNELSSLEKYGLVSRRRKYYYQISHLLIYKCLRELFHQDLENNSLPLLSEQQTLRLAAYYAVYISDQLKYGQERFPYLDTERQQIIEIIKSCVKHELWSAIIDLQKYLDPYLNNQGHWIDQIRICRAGVLAAAWLRDHKTERDIFRRLAATYYQVGKIEDAVRCEERALVMSEDLGDNPLVEIIRENLGKDKIEQEKPQQIVIEERESALKAAIEEQNLLGQWESLMRLIAIYQEMKQFDRAIEHFQPCLEVAEKIPNLYYLIRTLKILGAIYRENKQVEYSITALRLALDMIVEEGFSGNLASEIHGELARTHNEEEKNIYHYQMAIQLSPFDAASYNNLGFIFLQSGDINRAEFCFNQRINLRPFDALCAYVSLGIIASKAGSNQKAETYFRTALAAWGNASKKKIVPYDLEFKALALLGLGYENEAMHTLHEAFSQAEEDLSLDDCDFILYDLFAESPSPPSGLEKMRRFWKEKLSY